MPESSDHPQSVWEREPEFDDVCAARADVRDERAFVAGFRFSEFVVEFQGMIACTSVLILLSGKYSVLSGHFLISSGMGSENYREHRGTQELNNDSL